MYGVRCTNDLCIRDSRPLFYASLLRCYGSCSCCILTSFSFNVCCWLFFMNEFQRAIYSEGEFNINLMQLKLNAINAHSICYTYSADIIIFVYFDSFGQQRNISMFFGGQIVYLLKTLLLFSSFIFFSSLIPLFDSFVTLLFC